MFNNTIYSHATVINLAKEMRSSSKKSFSNEVIFEIKYSTSLTLDLKLNAFLGVVVGFYSQ